MRPLLLICGPTACHKSETALRIAEKWGGDILSIDSVAVYRGMDIGSAKPDAAERQRVPSLSPAAGIAAAAPKPVRPNLNRKTGKHEDRRRHVAHDAALSADEGAVS